MKQKLSTFNGFLFLVLVPFCLMFAAFSLTLGVYKARYRQNALETAEKELINLCGAGKNDYFVQQALNAYAENLDWQTLTKAQGAAMAADADLKKMFGAKAEFYFFGADFKLVYASPQSLGKFVIQKIYKALAEAEQNLKSSEIRENRPYFNAFIGGASAEDLLKEKAGAVKIISRGQRCFFYWNTFEGKAGSGLAGGIAAIIPASAFGENFAIKRLIAKKNKEAPTERLFGLAQGQSKKGLKIYMPRKNGFNIEAKAIAKELSLHKTLYKSKSYAGNFLIKSMPFEADKTLFAAINTVNGPYEIVELIVKAMLIAFFLFSSKNILMTENDCQSASANELIQSLYEKNNPDDKPIGYIAAFAAPAFLLSAMCALTFMLFNESLNAKSFNKIADCHNFIDGGYTQKLGRLENLYSSLSRHNIVKSLNGHKLHEVCCRLFEKNMLSRMYVFNKEGRALFYWHSDKSREDIFIKFLPVIARNIYISQSLTQKSLKDELSGNMLRAFADNYADLLGSEGETLFKTLENLNTLGEFNIANQKHYVYASFVENANKKDSLLMFAFCGARAYAKAYLEEVIRENANNAKQEIMLAMVPKNASLQAEPASICKYPFVFRLSERVKNSETRQTCIDTMSDGQYFIAASGLKQVKAYILFGMLKKQDSSLKTTLLVLFSLSGIIYCVLLPFYLSRRL